MKKVFGLLLIIIGSILSLANLMSTIPNFIKFLSNTKSFDAHGIGYLLGIIIFFLLLTALSVFLIIKGAKLAKSSRQKIKESVEDY
jgi:hypothetical protein